MAKLHFYYSAMNAGKSTALLQAAHNYKERGMNALLLTPAIDTRSGKGVISSRIGLTASAMSFDITFNIFEFVQTESQKNFIHCVLIDEGQFLKKAQVRQLSNITTDLNIPVLVYGLRTDFIAEPFEGSKYLLAWAEALIEIKTVCHCGKKATMNLRIDEHGNAVRKGKQIEIG
ncbi:MAG: thymidine kinase, partial [Gammaproteobacteria bacterium RIFOXYB2_FULL_38_6]